MSENEKPPENPGVFARLRPAPVLNYLIMCGAGLLLYAFVMFGQGNDIGAILAVIIAIPGVLGRWTGSPILIILLTIYLKIDPGFFNVVNKIMTMRLGGPWLFPTTGSGFVIEDAFLAAGFLAYAIGHFRLLALVHQSMPEDPTTRREMDPKNPPRRPASLISPDELQRTLIVFGGCVLAAQVFWWTLSAIDGASRPGESQLSPGPSRLLFLIWFAGSVLAIASGALIYLRANRMSRTEAALSLRDDFFQENRRETDRLQRWRKWFKEKTAMRRRKTQG